MVGLCRILGNALKNFYYIKNILNYQKKDKAMALSFSFPEELRHFLDR